MHTSEPVFGRPTVPQLAEVGVGWRQGPAAGWWAVLGGPTFVLAGEQAHRVLDVLRRERLDERHGAGRSAVMPMTAVHTRVAGAGARWVAVLG